MQWQKPGLRRSNCCDALSKGSNDHPYRKPRPTSPSLCTGIFKLVESPAFYAGKCQLQHYPQLKIAMVASYPVLQVAQIK